MLDVQRRIENEKHDLTCQRCNVQFKSTRYRDLFCPRCAEEEYRRLTKENGAASNLTAPVPFGNLTINHHQESCQAGSTPENGEPESELPRFPSGESRQRTNGYENAPTSYRDSRSLGSTTTYPTPLIKSPKLVAAFKLMKPIHKLYRKDHQSSEPVLNHGASGWPHRAAYCYERILPGHIGAELRRSIEDGGDGERIGISQVVRCSSIHLCPVCAYMSNMRWQSDLKQVEDNLRESGHRLLLFVLTISHTDKDTLRAEMDILRKAYTGVFGQRKKSQKKRAVRWGIVGRYRAWDIVYGRNGWHAHVNVVVAVDPMHPHYKLEDIHADFDNLYRVEVQKAGGFASMAHGFNVSEYKNNKCYSVKSGMDGISIAKVGENWSITREAVSGSKKQVGVDIGTLRSVLSCGMYHGDGFTVTRSLAERLCLEYAATMLGERSVVSSGVFRSAIEEVRNGGSADEDHTEMIPGGVPYVTEGVIESREWATKIIVPDRLPALIAAMKVSREETVEYLHGIGVSLLMRDQCLELAAQSSYARHKEKDTERAIENIERGVLVSMGSSICGEANDLNDFL